jgi:Holliday junction DNA helicase RuvA
MIAHIAGEVTDKSINSVVVDVNGIGYEVYVSERDIENVPSSGKIMLFTHFAVRENAQELYGFMIAESKRLFELLLGVSGVGPKVAMSIAGLGTAAEVKSAIASSNVAYIQSASGVGKRGAEKVIVELKDKVGVTGDDSFVVDQLNESDDAAAALVALGYSATEATKALSNIDASLDVEARVKAALTEMNS